jgi:predicted nuclease of predicted toxin-antitoxin system
MRFLADMGISKKSVIWLRNQGYDIIHLSEQGLQCMLDEDIFMKAKDENRVVLTMDLDFSQIVAASKSTLPSVIVFRLSNERSENVNKKLEELLNKFSDDIKEGSIISVSENNIRIRHLPI